MAKSDTRTRTLSLRAPIANEDERALFQRRLGLAALLVFVLAFGFWVAAFVGVVLVAREHTVHFITHPSSLIQLATCFGALAVALVLRRRKISVGTLSLLDVATFVAICFGWTFMIMFGRRGVRPEMIVLLASSYTLVARAAFIPSTPVRTALVGLISFAPLVPVTLALDNARDPNVEPLAPAVYTGIWTVVGISATTVISYVVHGLRLQVRRAMQLGQYVLEGKIGEGGMGVVYRASHALLRRPAAIKLLENVADHSVKRFEREVQITARLTHPNTVAVFDYGHTPDGTFYYAMEMLDGVTLEDLVTEHGAQPPQRVVHILLQACGALEEAHAAGLVHRDIKPANIMLTERGLLPDVVKVLDFGLVKEVDANATNPSKTAVNSIMGTPHYMAPEAITDPDTIDARADLYALGATAYYLLTGERVFDGANLIEVCSQHLHEKPVPPSKKNKDVPRAVEEIVLACLAKKKEDRPADAGKLSAMLEGARRETGEWSRDEARAWWSKHSKKLKSAPPQPVSAFGKTIAVALEDRGAA